MSEIKKSINPMEHYNMSDLLRGQASKIITSISENDTAAFILKNGKPMGGCDKMVNHFVAASFLRLYFIIFSSAVSLLRKNARKPPYPHKTFNYIVLGGNPYTHYFCGSSRKFGG